MLLESQEGAFDAFRMTSHRSITELWAVHHIYVAGSPGFGETAGGCTIGGMDGDDDIVLVAIDVPLVGDERRKNWAKIVTNVDVSLASGWAFEGEFIATGGIQDVPIGSIVLLYGERGSRTNPQIEARVLRVNADATVSHLTEAKGRAWARTLRDEVVELLAQDSRTPIERIDWEPALMRYSTEALRNEIERRDLNSATDPSMD
jgi:hypothetical protein